MYQHGIFKQNGPVCTYTTCDPRPLEHIVKLKLLHRILIQSQSDSITIISLDCDRIPLSTFMTGNSSGKFMPNIWTYNEQDHYNHVVLQSQKEELKQFQPQHLMTEVLKRELKDWIHGRVWLLFSGAYIIWNSIFHLMIHRSRRLPMVLISSDQKRSLSPHTTYSLWGMRLTTIARLITMTLTMRRPH